jgi:hypothetical protein
MSLVRWVASAMFLLGTKPNCSFLGNECVDDGLHLPYEGFGVEFVVYL